MKIIPPSQVEIRNTIFLSKEDGFRNMCIEIIKDIWIVAESAEKANYSPEMLLETQFFFSVADFKWSTILSKTF